MTTVERALIFTGKDMLLWVLVLGAVALVLAVVLYRVERRLVRPAIGTLLVALRVLAITLLLLMFLEPVISVTETTSHKSTLLVLIDVSHSMMIPDTTLPPGEALDIACALGKLPPEIRTSPLAQLADDLDRTADSLNASLADWQRLTDSLALQETGSKPLLARFDSLVRELSDWQRDAKAVVSRIEAAAPAVSGAVDLPSALQALAPDLARTVQKLETDVLAPSDRILADLNSADLRSALDVASLDRLTRRLQHLAAALADSVQTLRTVAQHHNDLLAAALTGPVKEELDKTVQSTRLELVQQIFSARAGLLPRDLADKYDVVIRAFAGSISGNLVTSPDGVLALGPEDARTRLAPDFTDLASNLKAALAELGDKKLAGIVVISDGCFNRGPDPASLVPELAKRHVPVHAVLMGATHPPRDLALVGLEGPDTLFENDQAAVSAVVQGVGFDGQNATVTLSEGDRVLSSQKVLLKDAAPRQVVSLSYTPVGIGEHALDVVVEPLPGELIPNNNRASLVVRVVKDKNKVLLLEGAPRWEYRYLKNALARDNRIDLTALLFDPVVLSGQEPDHARAGFPDSRPKLLAYDVVVLGDVGPADLSADQLRMLESFVADRGGALVVIPGRSAMPDRFKGTVLDQLLPVVPLHSPGGVLLPDGYAFTPTQDGASSTILRMSVDPIESDQIWKELPVFYWYYPVDRVKPGATVLAECKPVSKDAAPVEAPAPRNPDGSALSTSDRLARNALLVEQSYGLGKVLWMGSDSTWRWRYKVADKYHYRFWGQVVRWATAGSLPVGTDTTRFGTDRGSYQEGQDVTVCARVLSPDLTPVTDAQVEAVLLRQVQPDKPQEAREVARIRLSYVSSSGGRYEGVLSRLGAGRYYVKLVVPGREAELKDLAASFAVTSAPIRELTDLAANRPLMARLASGTSGRLYAPADLPELTRHLPRVDWTEKNSRQTPLWESFYFLVPFALVITVEWIVRKRQGLL